MATWRRSGLRFPEGRGPVGRWAKVRVHNCLIMLYYYYYYTGIGPGNVSLMK